MEAEASGPDPNLNSDSHTAEGATSPPPTAAPLPVATADEARGQVFEWLHDSFESLRSQLRVLSDAVSRQERTLDTMSEAGVAAERLAALADVLHDRIADVVHGAITSQEAEPNGGAKRVDSLGGDPATTHVHQPSAATARPAINSSGWQERLLALRPAGSQSGG